MSFDQVSVEANSDGFHFKPINMIHHMTMNWSFCFGTDLLPDESIVAGYCESADLVGRIR